MNIATRFWGWALLAAGLSLATLVWSPSVSAAHIDGEATPSSKQCEKDFKHLTLRQQALCATIAVSGEDPAESGSKVEALIQNVVTILSFVAVIAAVIVIVVQGLRMVLSSGDSNAIAGARNGIIYAIVGLAIAIAAPHIVGYVLSAVSL